VIDDFPTIPLIITYLLNPSSLDCKTSISRILDVSLAISKRRLGFQSCHCPAEIGERTGPWGRPGAVLSLLESLGDGFLSAAGCHWDELGRSEKSD